MKPRPPKPAYIVEAKWRNGWQLVRLDDRYWLRRMMRGQYRVNAQRQGLIWYITLPATGERVYPERLG